MKCDRTKHIIFYILLLLLLLLPIPVILNENNKAHCYSHFEGYAPTGGRVADWFESYPDRIPLLGNLTTDETTVAREIKVADTALDFFDLLYYDGGADCGYNKDPNLRWCLDTTLAFMLNTTAVWGNTTRLHFFITYSNDIDSYKAGAFVGDAGEAKWALLVRTWIGAMQHPRYLKINQRPVFKILIPAIFLNVECNGDSDLATLRISQLRAAATAAGLHDPLVGGGWENPSVPNTGGQPPSPDKKPPAVGGHVT